jgi:hypothetical protein
MPPGSRAHLLLPSPLGLVHYDLVDEAAFLGPSAKGLLASPMPFPAAKLAVRADGGRYVVRPLPGEPPPEVNGAPSEGAPLGDGDRIRVGEHVALFRAAPGTVPVAAPAAAAPSSQAGTSTRARRAGPPARPVAPRSMAHTALALSLVGGVLLLFAVYQAVHFLQTPGGENVPRVAFAPRAPTEAESTTRSTERATSAYEAARAFERDHGAELADVVERYRAVGRDFPGAPAAAFALARVTELWPRVAEQRWKEIEPSIGGLVNSRKYRSAIEMLYEFDRRFAGTPAAAPVADKIAEVRAKAREALDVLRQRVTPMIATDSTRAYRLLTSAGLELPSDLEAELAALMARVRQDWGTHASPTEPGGPDTAGGTASTKPGGAGTTKPKQPPLLPPLDDGEGGPKDPRDAEAKALWKTAKEDLDAKRWEAARKGFATLLKQYGSTAIVTSGVEKIRAGRGAADLMMRGAAALLKGDATTKNDRLEVTYTFENDKAFTSDFVLEQPFPSEEATSAEVRSGMAILSGDTAMMLKVVFDPSDVTIEMDAVADEHKDYGLFGLEESKTYRAVALDVGNTQFKLKKGPAAQVLAGHVLWLYGDGVWRDADKGERGFVRIAEKKGNGLKGGERVHCKLELRAGHVDGEIHAKGDSADLKGPLKGDDGKGIEALRVGAFAFKGRVGIEKITVSGKVEPGWLAKELEKLLAAAGGPE